jgi:NTE family protein
MASLDPGRPSGVMGHIERLLRNAMSRRLDAEVAILRATGIRVLRVDPGAADLTVMGPNIMDGRRRLATLETSLRTSKATVARALAHQSFASSADAGTPMPEQKTAAR